MIPTLADSSSSRNASSIEPVNDVQIVEIYANYPTFQTEVLVASVRNPLHVVEAGRIGADVVTVPPSVLRQMYQHPLTDKGLAAFMADWEKTGQTVL